MYIFMVMNICEVHSDIFDNPNIFVLRQKSSMKWFTRSWIIFRMLRGSWSTECCLRKRKLFWRFLPVIRYGEPGLIYHSRDWYHMSFTSLSLWSAGVDEFLERSADGAGEHSQTEWGDTVLLPSRLGHHHQIMDQHHKDSLWRGESS